MLCWKRQDLNGSMNASQLLWLATSLLVNATTSLLVNAFSWKYVVSFPIGYVCIGLIG